MDATGLSPVTGNSPGKQGKLVKLLLNHLNQLAPVINLQLALHMRLDLLLVLVLQLALKRKLTLGQLVQGKQLDLKAITWTLKKEGMPLAIKLNLPL
jgi:hypothetical protein